MQKKIYLLSAFLLLSFFQLTAQTSLRLPSQEVNCGETLILPITVDAFQNLQGISFSLKWDTTQLSFVGSDATDVLKNNGTPGTNVNDTDQGIFGFTWFGRGPLNFTSGDSILLVTFEVTGNNFTTASVSFTDDIVDIVGTINDGAVRDTNNLSSTSATLTLVDTETPNITCPSNQSAMTTAGSTSVAVPNLTPTTMDNCGIASLSFNTSGATTIAGTGDASDQSFNIGLTTVTYVVEDFAGNADTCSFEVTVTEGTVSAGDSLTVIVGSISVECDAATVNVPVSVSRFEQISNLQSTFSWNSAELTFTGITNFDLDSLGVSNFDTTGAANGQIVLNWNNTANPSKSDGAPIFTFQFTNNGILTNTSINVSDVSAQQNGTTFPARGSNGTISIQDTTDPEVTCPSNQTVLALPGQLNVSVDDIGATAMDNCGGTPTLTYTLTGATIGNGTGDASGTAFNIGETTVTYTATDASNNTDTCSFTVTVNGQEPTRFTLSAASQSAACDADEIAVDITTAVFDSVAGTQFSVNWNSDVLTYERIGNIQYDDAGFDLIDVATGKLGYSWFDARRASLNNGDVLFTIFFTPAGGGTSPITFGDTPTPIEINSGKGGMFAVIPRDSLILTSGVVNVTDTEAPTVSCPDNQTIALPMGQTSAVVNDLDAFVFDNCGVADLTYTLSGATTGSGIGFATGQTFNIGTTTLTYIATDGGGNTDSCTTTVILTAPNAIQVNVVPEPANCGDETYKIDITVDSFTNVLGLQFSVNWDETILSYDSIGNLALPEFSAGNFSAQGTANGELGFAWFNDSSIEGETLPDGAVLFSIFYSITGAPGATTNVSITDAPVAREGNVLTTNGSTVVPVIGNGQSVTVIDNTPPTLTNPLPDVITLHVNADSCHVVGGWMVPIPNDDCSNNIGLTSTSMPTDTFGVGERLVIYTATDAAGNSFSDTTRLIVLDTIAPILIGCPTDIMLTADENCQAVGNWTPPTVAENCDLKSFTTNIEPGTVFNQVSTTVTYAAEDIYGNVSTCSFVVTVDGVTPIVFEGFPGDIMVNAAQGQCGANIGWLPPTATGGCNANDGIVVVTATNEPGDFFPVGVNTVVYTATDNAGQVLRDSFTVTVIDNQDIVVVCPTDIVIQADGTILQDDGNFINSITSDSCGRYVITYNDITTFDNCSPINQTQVQGPISSSQFTFGTTQMEFVLSDTLGNDRNCTFQITINETNSLQARTLDNPTCAGDDLRLSVDTLIGGSYQWTGPGNFIANVQNPVIPNAMTQLSGNYVVKVISENGCTIKDSIEVGILSGPEVMASGTDLSCTGETDTIRLFANTANGVPIQTYQWIGPNDFSTDVQNPIIPDATTGAVGQYIVKGTSSNGCSATDTVVIGLGGMVMPTLTSNIGSDTVCANNPFTLTGTGYPGLVTYTWIADDNAGLPADLDTNILVITPTAAGTYTYQFTANLDGNCTSDTAQLTVFVIDGAGVLTLGSNSPLICASSAQTIDLTVEGETNAASYAWSGPNGFMSDEQNPSVPASDTASGTYTLVVTATNGCTSTSSINVEVTMQGVAPEVTLSSASTNVCEGDALTLTATDTTEGVTYSWNGPNGFMDSTRIVTIDNVMADDAGAYQLRITKDGCTSAPQTVGPINVLSDLTAADDVVDAERNQTVSFSVIDNDELIPGVPFTIEIVSPATNGTLTNNDDGTFDYRPNVDYVGMDQILYEICYTDCPDLCAMATITIRTEFPRDTCIIPTFLSPNGDGFNDALIISCVPDPPKAGSELIVFNEWGSEVFRESPYLNNWQGTYNGEDLPDGTYYYIFKEDNDDQDPIKGYVTIFR
ncbi:MAG: HYR domain-containing protein [Bacteroidota bacterium]